MYRLTFRLRLDGPANESLSSSQRSGFNIWFYWYRHVSELFASKWLLELLDIMAKLKKKKLKPIASVAYAVLSSVWNRSSISKSHLSALIGKQFDVFSLQLLNYLVHYHMVLLRLWASNWYHGKQIVILPSSVIVRVIWSGRQLTNSRSTEKLFNIEINVLSGAA